MKRYECEKKLVDRALDIKHVYEEYTGKSSESLSVLLGQEMLLVFDRDDTVNCSVDYRTGKVKLHMDTDSLKVNGDE